MRLAAICLLGLLSAGTAAAQASCKATPFGKRCGPSLTGRVQPKARFNVVTFGITKGAANSAGVLLFAAKTASIPLPGGCTLGVLPLVAISVRTDANGSAPRTISVPRDLTGTTLVQAAVLDPGKQLKIGTSNGIRLVCTKKS